jgi:hypothetical protein
MVKLGGIALAVITAGAGAAPQVSDLQLRDIKPPVHIPSPYAWLWWTLGLLALAALLYLAWRWWKNRPAPPPPPPVPPHQRALRALEAALQRLSEPREFCILVSDILRQYLEERFDFAAPERTTEEFLLELRATPRLTEKQKDILGDFLQRCDLVKFAKYEPTEAELRDLHGAAVRLVEETIPRPEPEPAAKGVPAA